METFSASSALLLIIYFLWTSSYPLDNSRTGFKSVGSVENNSRFQDPFLQEQNITTNCRILSDDYDNLPWRNKFEIISFDTYILCERIITGIFAPLVCMFGVVANTLNCIVFYKHGLRHRINFLLFSHSCTDLAYVFYLFLFFSERLYLQMIGQYNNYGPLVSFLTNTGMHTFNAFTYASGFLSTLIATERCLCIVKPFSIDWLMKTKHMCVVVCTATTVLVSAHYVATERYKVACVYDTEMDAILYTYFPSDFYTRNTVVINIFAGVLYGLGLPTVFISVTILSTILTAVHLRTAVEWRQEARNGTITQKEVTLTKMLITTSCMFISFKLPEILLRTTPLIVPDFRVGGVFQNSFMTLVDAFMLTSTTNSSLNILIYFKMGSKFRSSFKQLFLGWGVLEKRRHSSLADKRYGDA